MTKGRTQGAKRTPEVIRDLFRRLNKATPPAAKKDTAATNSRREPVANARDDSVMAALLPSGMDPLRRMAVLHNQDRLTR